MSKCEILWLIIPLKSRLLWGKDFFLMS